MLHWLFSHFHHSNSPARHNVSREIWLCTVANRDLYLTDSLNFKWFLCMWKRTCWEIDFSVQIILCKLVSEREQIKHFHLQIGLLLNCTKWTFSSLIYTIGFCHFLLLRLTLWNSCGSKIFNKSIWNKLCFQFCVRNTATIKIIT